MGRKPHALFPGQQEALDRQYAAAQEDGAGIDVDVPYYMKRPQPYPVPEYICVGDAVDHDRYGEGRIVDVDEEKGRITVRFGTEGRDRTFAHPFAFLYGYMSLRRKEDMA